MALHTLADVATLAYKLGATERNRSGDRWTVCCPAHNDHNPSLDIELGDSQIVVICRAGCEQRDVVERIKSLGFWPNGSHRDTVPWTPPAGPRVKKDKYEDRTKRIFEWFSRGLPLAGTPGELYCKRRGLDPEKLGSDFKSFADGYRFNKASRNSVRRPAIIMQRRSWPPSTPPVGGQIVWLEQDGTRAEEATGLSKGKDFFGPQTGAVWVTGEFVPDRALAIVEGWETGASVAQLINTPCNVWAAMNDTNMVKLTLPPRSEVPLLIIAADHDEPGIKHASRAAHKFQRDGYNVALAVPPHGGDWNDFLLNPEMSANEDDVMPEEFMTRVSTSDVKVGNLNIIPADEWWKILGHEDRGEKTPPKQNGEIEVNAFRCLGVDGAGSLYIWSASAERVAVFTPTQLVEKNLFTIAPRAWWLGAFAKGERIDILGAADFLIQGCIAEGFFDQSRIRDRGAWEDGDRLVYNHGTHLTVDRAVVPLGAIDSHYVYVSGPAIRSVDFSGALAEIDAGRRLVELTARFPWAQGPLMSEVVSAWAAIAFACGILDWRARLAINGPAASGKSTIAELILVPLLGPDAAILTKGKTTEAGYRQTLRNANLPGLREESEITLGQEARHAGMDEFLRSTIGEDYAATIMGGRDGTPDRFGGRTMVCTITTNPTTTRAFDVSRAINATLREPTRDENYIIGFNRLRDEITATLTPEFCQAIRTRLWVHMRDVLAAAKLFHTVLAERLDDSRIGDQFGVLAATWWWLTHDHMPKLSDAMVWFERHDQLNQFAPLLLDRELANEPLAVLRKILGSLLTDEGRHTERRVVDWAEIALGLTDRGDTDVHYAEEALRKANIRISRARKSIYLPRHGLEDMLRGTPYVVSYAAQLTHLPYTNKDVRLRVGDTKGPDNRRQFIEIGWQAIPPDLLETKEEDNER